MKIFGKDFFSSFYISSKYLSIYRIIYCLYIIIFTGLPSFSWLGSDYNYFFSPPELSLANLFNGFPNRFFFIILSLVNVVSFFFTFWGLWTKWSSLIFSCSCIVGFNFVYSFGKIDHGLLLFITPLILGLIGWGNYYSLDNWLSKKITHQTFEIHTNKNSFILAVFALMIGFSFFSSGLVKLYGGWWKWDIEAARYYLFINYYSLNRTKYLADWFIGINNHAFWKAQDYFTLVFELGFLASVIRIKLFRIFLSFAVIFHCLVLLMLNISFGGNFIIYLLFINWKKLHKNVFEKTFTRFPIKIFLKIVFASSVLLLFTWIHGIFINPEVAESLSLLNILSRIINIPEFARQLTFILAGFTLLLLLIYNFLDRRIFLRTR